MIKATLITEKCSDLKAVNAARVSMAKQSLSFEEDVKGNERLINYLGSHHHWTPFSHNRETILFPMMSLVEYYHFLEMITVNLSLEEKASLVLQNNINVHGAKYLAVKTSMFGWTQILENLSTSYMGNDGITGERIISVLSHKYPYSSKALISEELRKKFTGNFNTYLENKDILDFVIPQLEMKMFDVTFYETVPIFVARQRFKHMVGFTYNEVSRRYVDDLPELFHPEVWRQRPDKSIKQGSGADCVNQKELITEYDAFCKTCLDYYNKLIDKKGDNTAPEMARMVLPQSMMTEYFVTGTLDAWLRFIKQREDNHAQEEIRDLAKLIRVDFDNIYKQVTLIQQSGHSNLSQMLEEIGVF